jgi:hypothetical protein
VKIGAEVLRAGVGAGMYAGVVGAGEVNTGLGVGLDIGMGSGSSGNAGLAGDCRGGEKLSAAFAALGNTGWLVVETRSGRVGAGVVVVLAEGLRSSVGSGTGLIKGARHSIGGLGTGISTEEFVVIVLAESPDEDLLIG